MEFWPKQSVSKLVKKKKTISRNQKWNSIFSDPPLDEMDGLSEVNEEMTLKQIFKFQSKIYESLIKLAQEDESNPKQILAQLREMEF